ncbi:MAG: sigma-54-dependent Fis family transcriptional regulator [Myxococcales bacterium]|nr:sigma-54-dependent Fis family transcriptional regulator [Myxococcales bacterium]
MRILLAEDDRTVRVTLRDALEDAGHEVVACADGSRARAALERERFDLLLSDVRMPGEDGITLFRHARRLPGCCAVILMTAFAAVEDAVAVMREGAHDYITKPFDIDELLLRVERVGEEARVRRALEATATDCEPASDDAQPRVELVGESPAIAEVRARVAAAAEAGVNVLVGGETGTGKELCARVLHQSSARASKPFVAVNCAAIPGELFEAEMFGHERGAFTGAVERRVGRLAAAAGGTLFLDEVGELPAEQQAKLLRAIESGRFEPLGSNTSVEVDVWLICASNRDLRAQIDAGGFRRDLFYRLNVIEVKMPPLRERRGDIPLLVSDLMRRIAERRHIELPHLTPAAISALLTYGYPGNVRELHHALEHGVALARGGAIDVAHLPFDMQRGVASDDSRGAESQESYTPLADAVRQFEHAYIERVLQSVEGKRGEAAKLLGISRKSLWLKLKE